MTETEKKVAVPEGFMTGKFPLKKRAYGEEQPGIKVAPSRSVSRWSTMSGPGPRWLPPCSWALPAWAPALPPR